MSLQKQSLCRRRRRRLNRLRRPAQCSGMFQTKDCHFHITTRDVMKLTPTNFLVRGLTLQPTVAASRSRGLYRRHPQLSSSSLSAFDIVENKTVTLLHR